MPLFPPHLKQADNKEKQNSWSLSQASEPIFLLKVNDNTHPNSQPTGNHCYVCMLPEFFLNFYLSMEINIIFNTFLYIKDTMH